MSRSANHFFTGASGSTPNYIEDVFSTYLYSGNSSTQTITNNIDLSTKGGLVWIKGRNSSYSNLLFTSGLTSNSYYMQSNGTNGESNGSPDFTGFNSNGFSLTAPYGLSATALNGSGYNFSSWSFAKAPKFFDVVTYTGNGVDGRIIASNHNMGSGVLGAVFIKRTNSSSTNWKSSFRGGQGGQIPWLSLNLSINDSYDAWVGGNVNPGINGFSVSAYEGNISAVNAVGGTYVAYLFAHNAGGFGLSGTDNVITCGSYVGNGSATGPVIDIGWEPQWILTKRATGGTGNWIIFDNMRGLSLTDAARLQPNGGNAESSSTFIAPTSTGFKVTSTDQDININNSTYVYMAIRRGPMKVPTVGTSVFSPEVQTPGGGFSIAAANSGFPIDWLPTRQKGVVTDWYQTSRLTNNYMSPNTSAAESAYTYGFDLMQGVRAEWSTNTTVSFAFRRAPGFFDVVAYTGNGTSNTINHNLGVEPELIIFKSRSAAQNWVVLSDFGPIYFRRAYLDLTNTGPQFGYGDAIISSKPSATSISLLAATGSNSASVNYVAYLFATCPGVSKVGTYTGNGGSSQDIDCGFTSGARFVLVKAVSGTGDWWVWDTARGITSGNDNSLRVNTTDAEVTTLNFINPLASGFTIVGSDSSRNGDGIKYIFLAIA